MLINVHVQIFIIKRCNITLYIFACMLLIVIHLLQFTYTKYKKMFSFMKITYEKNFLFI